jgi:hypothetical protein
MIQSWSSLNTLIKKATFAPLLEEDVAALAKSIIQTSTEQTGISTFTSSGAMTHIQDRLNTAMHQIDDASRANRSREERIISLGNARDALEYAFDIMQQHGITIHTTAIAYYCAACSSALGTQHDAKLWLAKSHAALVQCAKQKHQFNEMHTDFVPGHVYEMLSLGIMHWIKSSLRRHHTRRELRSTCVANILQALRELENEGVLKLPQTSSEDQRLLNYIQTLTDIT